MGSESKGSRGYTDKLREVQMHFRQRNSVRSSAKLLGVGCMTLKRFHHCQLSIGINHIKLAAVEMAKNNGNNNDGAVLLKF